MIGILMKLLLPGCAAVRRSFTLIEMLAVVIVLTLAATIGIAGMSSGGGHEVIQVQRMLVEMDARARVMANAVGAIDLKMNSDESCIELRQHNELKVIVAQVIPQQVRVVLQSEHNANTVTFDARGRAANY